VDAFESNSPKLTDSAFNIKAANILEALWNLTYLVGEEAEQPDRVRYYANLSEERIRAMIDILRDHNQL
jgi:hypothetical protein